MVLRRSESHLSSQVICDARWSCGYLSGEHVFCRETIKPSFHFIVSFIILAVAIVSDTKSISNNSYHHRKPWIFSTLNQILCLTDVRRAFRPDRSGGPDRSTGPANVTDGVAGLLPARRKHLTAFWQRDIEYRPALAVSLSNNAVWNRQCCADEYD